MSMWIVTTGNSDVILKHDKNWGNFYGEVRYDLECTEFAQPNLLDPKDKSAGYTSPTRVLGLVYGNQPDDYKSDLEFPLLDTYCKYFKDNNIEPEKIIILLTDQTQIFDEAQKIYEKCPYWQDTRTLKPLLEWYFKAKFDCQLEFLYLTPTKAGRGIDNWNETLSLVEETLPYLDYDPLKTVYVSHQAGTAAISSAVQFVSLGRFQKVQFLVSNEYFDEDYQQQSKSEAIASSNYWRGMQIQKAQALLKRFDYSGVKDLFSNLWKNQEDPLNAQEQKIINLLNIAIQWNSAKFKNFAQARGKKAQQRLQNWWWTGYEAAYLAVVRLEQDNTVEALFHSFRAVEGLIRGKAGPTTDPLYELIANIFPDWESNQNMKIFNKYTRDRRNNLFHQLSGMEESEVFKAWDTNNNMQWQSRVLGCLNFVSGEKFTSLKKASLMSDLHQELEEAIKNYELKNS
jgi:hypothetical protein